MLKQHGFALLELLVAMLVTVLLAVWGSNTLMRKVNDAGAQAMAAWMLTARDAFTGYIERYAVLLTQATLPGALGDKGYENWAEPSLSELKSDGLLSAGFPEQAMRGTGLALRVLRHGACPGSECRLEAVLYGTQPLRLGDSSRTDEQMVAQWMMAAQGWGGVVTDARPQFIRGPAFQFPNPPSGGDPLPAGTVALAITSEQLQALNYLRVADARDPQFQGSLTVLANISTQGSVSAQGDLVAQGSLRAADYLSIGAQNIEQHPCSPVGMVARNSQGGLLVCHANLWRPAARGGGGFMMHSTRGCYTGAGAPSANPVTGYCGCPFGYTPVPISDSGPPARPEDGRSTGYLCVG
jgi:prepilin-type N-terminal cleavage/methylation domain-containing protein